MWNARTMAIHTDAMLRNIRSENCWEFLSIAEDYWALLGMAEGTADHWLEVILKEMGKRHEMGDKKLPVPRDAEA